MLDKEVCKQCWEGQDGATRNEAGSAWLGTDEDRWNAGELWCPNGLVGKSWQGGCISVDVEGEPPEGCPHVFEHVVALEMKR